MYAAAIETLTTAERDDSIRAVVLTGADNFFCAGGNLNRLLENRALEQSVQADAIDRLHGWIDALRACPKPVIAAVEGAAAGAGFSLALACDLIVAGASAKFVMAYVQVGLTPDGGGSWFLTRALPRQLASEILLEGKPVPAPRLQALGLVNRVVPDGTRAGGGTGLGRRIGDAVAARDGTHQGPGGRSGGQFPGAAPGSGKTQLRRQPASPRRP